MLFTVKKYQCVRTDSKNKPNRFYTQFNLTQNGVYDIFFFTDQEDGTWNIWQSLHYWPRKWTFGTMKMPPYRNTERRLKQCLFLSVYFGICHRAHCTVLHKHSGGGTHVALQNTRAQHSTADQSSNRSTSSNSSHIELTTGMLTLHMVTNMSSICHVNLCR